jgi:hypothetical protein
MTYDDVGVPHLRVTLGSDNITITGDVNLVDTVTVNSTPEDPVHTHITEVGTSGILAVPYLPIGGTVDANVTFPSIYKISKDTNANSDSNRIFVNASGTVELGTTTLSALENITVSGSVSVSNFPAIQAVTGTFWQTTQPVSIATMPTTPVTGTFWQATQPVSIASLPEIEIKNDSGNPIPISATTAANSLANPISIQITKNGLAVSDTVGLPTRVINDEALISYARGKAVTESDVLNAFLVDKSGATENLGTTAATMSTVWGGTGLFPWTTFTGTGAKLYIKSLTNDPKVQGKSVTIEGLDSNYDILLETVTLHPTDTTTAVSTTNNFYRINRIYLSGANTNNLPHDYDIEVRYGSSSGTLVSKFTAPWGRGQNCFYTVPRGYEAFILSLNGNSGKMDEITSSLWFHPYGGTWTLQKSFKFISGTFDHNFRTPLRISEKSDIEIRAYALVESSRIGTEFQILVLPKA